MPEAGKDGQAGDDAGRAVEVASLGHGIEMGSAGKKGQLRLRALKSCDEVGAGVALGAQAERPRLGVDNVQRRALAFAVALSRDSDAVTRRRAKRIEQLGRELTHPRAIPGRCGCLGV